MARIAIFDSGFGSLSIIKQIQKTTKTEIIYFADQKNFPYGKKSKTQLKKIIKNTIKVLKDRFSPDLIIIGSNTPTLLLEKLITPKILGVLPPLKNAAKISKTNNIAILSTQLAINSKELKQYIKKNRISTKIKIHKINSSSLVELVESGKFITNKKSCKKIISKTLEDMFIQNNIDVATLSSTHLPFLQSLLRSEFPKVTFLDPAYSIAEKIVKLTRKKPSKRNKIKIFTSGNPKIFQNHLSKIGIKNKVNSW